MKSVLNIALVFALAVAWQAWAFAGVPLNNLEGVGGIAFNPLAYTAGTSTRAPGEDLTFKNAFSKPQFGVWNVRLDDVSIDWNTIGVAETIADRLEISYGQEVIAPTGKNIHKQNIGAKALLIRENEGELDFIPAVAVGAIHKQTSLDTPAGVDRNGWDYYVVATKLVKALPRPVLLSGGVLSTKARVTGVHGFDHDREKTLFGNIDVLPLDNVAVGFEYKQGARFTAFKNANYWDAHVAWFANKNLSLVAAYVDAGDEKSSSVTGLGQGVVLSAQYAF